MRWQRPQTAVVFLLGAVGLHVALLVFRAFFAWAHRSYSPLADLGAGMVSWLLLGLGGAVAAWIYRLHTAAAFRPSPAPPHAVARTSVRRPIWRTVSSLLALSWFATAVLGVPAVLTSLANDSVGHYKWFAQRQPFLLTAPFPHLEASVAVPVLPGVVIVSFGAQLAGQAGGGGWHIFAWWGAGSRQLYYWPRWMS